MVHGDELLGNRRKIVIATTAQSYQKIIGSNSSRHFNAPETTPTRINIIHFKTYCPTQTAYSLMIITK